MNHDDHPDDTALAQELRDCLSELGVPERPSLAAIISRGRVHRRRWLARFAGLGGAAVAGLALGLGLAGVFGADPARRTGPAQTAAFTLTSYSNGTTALNVGQLFDPAALQRALAQHGIRALVKTGSYCSSHPAAPDPGRLGVLSVPAPGSPRHRATRARSGRGVMESGTFPVRPSQLAPFVDPVTMVINPAAMPSGTELFIGNFNLGHTLFLDLIYTSAHTCRNSRQPPVTR